MIVHLIAETQLPGVSVVEGWDGVIMQSNTRLENKCGVATCAAAVVISMRHSVNWTTCVYVCVCVYV